MMLLQYSTVQYCTSTVVTRIDWITYGNKMGLGT